MMQIYFLKEVTYKDVTEAARAVTRELVDSMESATEPPASIQKMLLEFALELRSVNGKKQYGYIAHLYSVRNCPKDMISHVMCFSKPCWI